MWSLLLEADASCLGMQSCKTVLWGNYTKILWLQTLLWHFRMPIPALQMLCNEISLLVSQVIPSHNAVTWLLVHVEELICEICFHLPLFALTLFHTIQKTPQSSVKTFLRIKGFFFYFFLFWCVHPLFLKRHFKMCIKQGDGNIATV